MPVVCHGRGKLNIIEQEFKYAEKTEFWRLKEEEEMRRTIQVKRERALIDAKKIERARRIREENRIRKGIISAVKNSQTDNNHQMLDMYVPPVMFRVLARPGPFLRARLSFEIAHACSWLCLCVSPAAFWL